MFPPVLTTEGGWGWAARPGSTDDPSRPSWSRPKASRGAPIARAHTSFGRKGRWRVSTGHQKSKLTECPVGWVAAKEKLDREVENIYIGRGRRYVSTIL